MQLLCVYCAVVSGVVLLQIAAKVAQESAMAVSLISGTLSILFW
jgi:hypothetical protein